MLYCNDLFVFLKELFFSIVFEFLFDCSHFYFFGKVFVFVLLVSVRQKKRVSIKVFDRAEQ